MAEDNDGVPIADPEDFEALDNGESLVLDRCDYLDPIAVFDAVGWPTDRGWVTPMPGGEHDG